MAKILVVDDDPELAGQLVDWLTFESHTVATVQTGHSGWEQAQNCQYDLLILDWDLPDLNGIDLLRRYRSAGGSCPVLMLTGHDSVNDKAQGLDAGADDYLTKPFHMTELIARVRALMRRHGAQKSSKALGTNNEAVLARADLAGTLLASRYEFLEVLGEGGLGIVFKARHPIMEKFIAIKMLLASETNEETLERFKIEAKATSRLNHPGIVTIHDFGVTEREQPYMVMEYIEGKSLAAMLKQLGPPRLPIALDICIQVCDALAHAHEMSILHRDIKPSNIMLQKQ